MSGKHFRYARTLIDSYRFVAFALLNTIVALVLLNLALSIVFTIKDSLADNPVSARYSFSKLKTVYPEMDEREIDTLLEETWSRPYLYQPFTQFKEREFSGRYVNVDSTGFRIGPDQGPWPPQPGSLNVFMFGGSTTFGYGVKDDQTVAAQLQILLAQATGRKVHVYNFGQGHYYSTQERIQFKELLASGAVPDVALFMDGLNDFFFHDNEPLFTNRFRDFVAGNAAEQSGPSLISRSSLGRAVAAVNARLDRLFQPGETDTRESENDFTVEHRARYDDTVLIDAAINRYLQNKKLIEAVSIAYEVIPVFVWQPVPTYRYDQAHHLFAKGGYGRISYSRYGYQNMEKLVDRLDLGANFLWCADIQQQERRPLYVDKVHYSAYFSRKLAREISDLVVQRSLLDAVGTISGNTVR